MASIINAATSGGLISTADTSGILQLQTAGTTAVTVDASQNVTFANSASLPNTFGFKNRLINGAMVIDQRNAGAAVTPTAGTYTLDRYFYQSSQASKATIQQNAGSVTPPTGFTNYLGVTSTSAYSSGAGDFFRIFQSIEGLNVADLAWGTASAKTVTLSFWVRSSLTGTFGGSLQNSASNRSYPFTYTISSANTWEYETITIAGDTSGTWLTTNGTGVTVGFNIGTGTTFSGTAGAWAGANYLSATGATSVLATNGATFYITGIQFEVGSTATSFDVRDYGRELALCQRYLYKVSADGTNAPSLAMGFANSTTQVFACIYLPVSLRAAPTLTWSGVTVSDLASYTRNATVVSIGGSPATGLNVFRLAATESAFVPGGANQLGLTSSASSNVTLSAEL